MNCHKRVALVSGSVNLTYLLTYHAMLLHAHKSQRGRPFVHDATVENYITLVEETDSRLEYQRSTHVRGYTDFDRH